jgi:pimeloyl-ACP methyl ester carboxylesterase
MKKLHFIIFFLALAGSLQTYSRDHARMIEKKDTLFKAADGTIIKAVTGILEVPENRRAPNPRSIRVKYVWLKSLVASPAAPLIYLAGGPGNTCTWQAADPDYLSDWIPYLRICDVILYDQRGTADEDIVWYWKGDYPENFLVSAEAASDHYRTMAKQALPVFEQRGIDILGYTTNENAHDIEELRIALHIDTISILGFSYGTHLGLKLIELYGDHIRNAVLAGVEGMDHTFDYPLLMDMHFGKLAGIMRRDKQLSKDIPNLEKLLERVMRKLDQQPMEVPIEDPMTGKPMKVKVGSFGLALVLRLDMGDATDLPVVPRLIYSIDKGDPSILKWFIQKRIIMAYGIPGMSIMMDMASGASANRQKQIEEEAGKSLFKNVANFPFYDLIPVWPAVSAAPDHTIPIISEVRTLLISGEYDYNTPPAQAEEIKWGFCDATHLVVRNAGHEQLLNNQAIKKAIAEFLRGKDVGKTYATYNKLQFIPVNTGNSKLSHPAIPENGK